MNGFSLFVENEKTVVSFDFDGVLHTSVVFGTTNPINFFDWEEWEPNYSIHKKLKVEAQSNNIVVVSRRDNIHQEPMWDFIHAYNLPISQIYTTRDRPKRNTLIKLGAIRHYDDDKRMFRELDGTGIEFIYVNPHEE